MILRGNKLDVRFDLSEIDYLELDFIQLHLLINLHLLKKIMFYENEPFEPRQDVNKMFTSLKLQLCCS